MYHLNHSRTGSGESLGRTRASRRKVNVESTSIEGKMKRGLVYAKRRMKMTISDLPEDLVLEILTRVPMTSLISLRSTCKKWNALSKNRIFGKVAEAKNLFLGFTLMNKKVFSLRIDLQGIQYDGYLYINPVRVLNKCKVFKGYHCDGLLLFSIENDILLLWNPYLGQKRWIPYTYKPYSSWVSLSLGYDNNRNYKILEISEFWYNIYELSSNSWKALDVTCNWKMYNHKESVNLKGNTFFLAQERGAVDNMGSFLLSFDFTSERFGPRLSLPIHYSDGATDMLTLSCVGDEKLALLRQSWVVIQKPPGKIEIWITNKIDCNEVLWTKWMHVESGPFYFFRPFCESFVIDEEKKVAVLFYRGNRWDDECLKRHIFALHEFSSRHSFKFVSPHLCSFRFVPPHMFSSYVPSLAQIE